MANPINPVMVLVHRIVIDEVRDTAKSEGRNTDDILYDSADMYGGLLSTISVRLQYPLGMNVLDVEEKFDTISCPAFDDKVTVYGALKTLVTKIYGQVGLSSMPETYQFKTGYGHGMST